MAQNHPPTTMDPPHVTEFASERYFEKLHQLNASQQPPSSADPADSSASNSTPTFILPLRESKLADAEAAKPVEQKRDKGRFFGIRQKVSLLHSKTSHYEPESAQSSQTRASTESTRKW